MLLASQRKSRGTQVLNGMEWTVLHPVSCQQVTHFPHTWPCTAAPVVTAPASAVTYVTDGLAGRMHTSGSAVSQGCRPLLPGFEPATHSVRV